MTKQATLGPIDPSVNTPLNPQVPGGPPNARIPVSVEAINGFFELAKEELKINTSADLTSVLSVLTSNVHPLVLGQAYRTRSQIRMLGKRLLSNHTQDETKIEKLLSFLCSESGSHDYRIYRQEAQDELGLNINRPDDKLYGIIKKTYDNIVDELELIEPYDPLLLLKGEDEIDYKHKRALIESIVGGSHSFSSEGRLIKRRMVEQSKGIVQESVQDTRIFEGWKYERL